MHFLLLSGGSGSRLWPLSNEARSKQFLKVLRDENGCPVSMVQRTISGIAPYMGNADVTIATCRSQKAALESQVEVEYALVLEPERRDTAPAIMLSCAHLLSEQHASEDDLVIVLPIDGYAGPGYYESISTLAEIASAGAFDLVLLGAKPDRPSAKYGYIVPGQMAGTVRTVRTFKEKPAAEEAKQLIAQGALWNCGVFAFRLGYVALLLKDCLGTVAYPEVVSRYGCLPKRSFDYEVVEGASSVAVVSYDGSWKDLGTWNTLAGEMAEATSGRAVVDHASCSNVHVVNETGLPLVVAGLNDAVVVATPDGILVSDKEHAPEIKGLVARAAESRPMYEQRRWGEYRVLDSSAYPDGTRTLTKELVVLKGCQLSYQRHRHRKEVWTVASGRGQVVVDGHVRELLAGSTVTIDPAALHSVRAIDDMHIIEVQLGDSLEEEDIERFGEYWVES